MNVNREMLAFLRKQYPVGTRIRLDSMQDSYAPVEAGTTGKLDYIDDAGQFHMKWDNGRTLALIPGVDSFTVLPPELSMTKLYMPLNAELYEPDVYGNMQEEPELLTGHDLTAYEDHIRSALVKYRMPEETTRGIMHWYDAADSVNDKVRSVTFDVERRDGKLWGIAECQISGELSAAELTTLKEYIEGQASDGWGEGFEQHEIAVGRGSELYVHLWQDHGWSIQTEQERFRAHFDKLPEMCFTLLPGTGQLICIKRGESGYYPSDWSKGKRKARQFCLFRQNCRAEPLYSVFTVLHTIDRNRDQKWICVRGFRWRISRMITNSVQSILYRVEVATERFCSVRDVTFIVQQICGQRCQQLWRFFNIFYNLQIADLCFPALRFLCAYLGKCNIR